MLHHLIYIQEQTKTMYFYMYILTYIKTQNTFLNYISQVMRAILGRGVELSWCQGVFCGIFIIRTLYNGVEYINTLFV